MSENITEFRGIGPSQPAQQLARIATLLGELEALSYGAKDVPLPLLVRTRASIEKARSVLVNCDRLANRAAAQDKNDPQPDIDHDALERMYRALGNGRPPEKR